MPECTQEINYNYIFASGGPGRQSVDARDVGGESAGYRQGYERDVEQNEVSEALG